MGLRRDYYWADSRLAGHGQYYGLAAIPYSPLSNARVETICAIILASGTPEGECPFRFNYRPARDNVTAFALSDDRSTALELALALQR